MLCDYRSLVTETWYFSSFPATEQETAWPRMESSPVSFVHNNIKAWNSAQRRQYCNTSVRKTDICYRRKHILCGLFKAVAVLGIERSLSVTVTVRLGGQSVSLTVTVSHNSHSLAQSDRCSPTYQVTEIWLCNTCVKHSCQYLVR